MIQGGIYLGEDREFTYRPTISGQRFDALDLMPIRRYSCRRRVMRCGVELYFGRVPHPYSNI